MTDTRPPPRSGQPTEDRDAPTDQRCTLFSGHHRHRLRRVVYRARGKALRDLLYVSPWQSSAAGRAGDDSIEVELSGLTRCTSPRLAGVRLTAISTLWYRTRWVPAYPAAGPPHGRA